MIFNDILGFEKIDNKELEINNREAIRAVILKDDKILMISTNKGDLKFPGGGVESKETHEETLNREVREESGYLINNVKEKLGEIVERKLDDYEENKIFQMTSYYYLCDVYDDIKEQELDDYEAELNFEKLWITLDEAIKLNEKVINNIDRNPWVDRETYVLKKLKDYYISW